MIDKNDELTITNLQPDQDHLKSPDNEPDLAGKSLADALRVSFGILKVIMIVLIVIFFASGFRTVEPNEQALVLRFGRIKGLGENRILGPGLHWVMPYPVEEMVKIPVGRKLSVAVDDFWYFETAAEKMQGGSRTSSRSPQALNPLYEGYTLTRSSAEVAGNIGSTGNDYGIVHSKWLLVYAIREPELFFRNNFIDIDSLKSGQIYQDIIPEYINPILKDLLQSSVVTAMTHYTIEQTRNNQGTISSHVRRLMQEKLDKIESGIEIDSIQITDTTWPRQVNNAFLASITASQFSQRQITEAQSYSSRILNEAGGPVAGDILAAVKNPNLTEEERQFLWAQLAGQAQTVLDQARAYRTTVVETAKANAAYLEQILPEYRLYPQLVTQELYHRAIEQVLSNTQENMIIQPSQGNAGREIRLLINRDPAAKSNDDSREQR